MTFCLAAGFICLWNTGFIGAEYALPFTEPLTLLFWRYWLSCGVLLGYLLLRGHLRWPGLRAVGSAFGVGVLAHGVWLGCVFYALRFEVPAGIVALVVALQPMATGALSGPVVGEPTPPARWAGLVMGLGGVLIAVLARIEFSDPVSVFAYLIPFGSVAAITAASLIERRLEVMNRPSRLHGDVELFYQSLGVALAVTPFAVGFEGLETEWTPVFTASLLWLTVAVSLTAYGLMWRLIKRMDATRTASLFYFGPPVTMLMAWAAFGDRLRETDMAGLAVIAAGVCLTQLGGGRAVTGPARG